MSENEEQIQQNQHAFMVAWGELHRKSAWGQPSWADYSMGMVLK